MAKFKSKMWVILLAIVVILVVVGYYLWQNGWKLPGTAAGIADYQAIFLSNGQVYFGRASQLVSDYVRLTDVYYLQVSQVLQPAQGKGQPQPTQAISLAKLGVAELHRPKDEMLINRAQILFIETMTSDSQVVQAIKSYKQSLTKTSK